MLLANYSQLNASPGRQVGGATNPVQWYKGGCANNFYYGDATQTNLKKSSFPYLFSHPHAWILAPKSGITIDTTLTSAGLGSITLIGQLIVNATMTADGSGTFSADIQGILQGTMTAAGSSSTTFDLGAILNTTMSSSGSGSMTMTISGIGNMTMEITPFTTLSPENLAASVWNAVAADFNTSGTMGEKLNAAGTAGDPWTTDLTGYNTTDTAGKILKQIKTNSNLIPAAL